MNFVKGVMLGMVAGAIIGVVNSETLTFIARQGKKGLKKMKRKYNFA